MTYDVSGAAAGRPTHTPRWLVMSATAGLLHAAITFYWAAGGQELVWTMGHDFIAQFSSMMWLLYPLGAVKAAAVIGPLFFNAKGWPFPRITRTLCWIGATVLVVWGGMNTVVGNAVLFGLLRPQGGFDRSSMVGHAWIWDPLFLAWGLALLAGLTSTRRGLQRL